MIFWDMESPNMGKSFGTLPIKNITCLANGMGLVNPKEERNT